MASTIGLFFLGGGFFGRCWIAPSSIKTEYPRFSIRSGDESAITVRKIYVRYGVEKTRKGRVGKRER